MCVFIWTLSLYICVLFWAIILIFTNYLKLTQYLIFPEAEEKSNSLNFLLSVLIINPERAKK